MIKIAKSIVRQMIERAGYRIFPKSDFYHNFLPYNRWGSEPIHYWRHFVNVDRITTCFDIGANRGQTAKYFAATFPAAKITSFEPIGATYAQLVTNTSHLPQVKTFNFAFGSKDERKTISLAQNDQLNTLVNRDGASSTEEDHLETVQIRTLNSFIIENQIDRIHLLKTDTEGFDLEVLRGGRDAFEKGRIDLVYCEVGFRPDDHFHTYFDGVLKFLLEYDFTFLGLYETVFCDNPSQIFHANALFGRKNSDVILPWLE